MIRKIALTASAVALAATGLGLAAVAPATAAITITAGTGSSITCNDTSVAKLSPPLKDDWIQSQHASDPNADVVAIPDHQYAPNPPEKVSAKGVTDPGSCSGTVTDGSHSSGVSKIAITLASDPAHVGADEASCVGLVTPGPPSAARYNITLKYTASVVGDKITATTITDASINPDFSISGGTITGSFAGGTSNNANVPDLGTLGILTQELSGPGGGPVVATSASPAAPNVCQAGLKIKTGAHHSATKVTPKGLKAIGITTGSTFSISKP